MTYKDVFDTMDIYGKRVKLRAIEYSDLEALRSFHNDPIIAQNIGGWSFPISSVQQEEWFAKLNNNLQNQRWAIEVDGLFLGISTLTNIDYKYRNAEHGIMIGSPEARGKGYGFDTIMATMRYAFEELQLHRLDANIIESNAASLKVYTEKCGWKQEGLLRQHIFRNNRYYNRVLVGILKEEYEELCEQTGYWNS